MPNMSLVNEYLLRTMSSHQVPTITVPSHERRNMASRSSYTLLVTNCDDFCYVEASFVAMISSQRGDSVHRTLQFQAIKVRRLTTPITTSRPLRYPGRYITYQFF